MGGILLLVIISSLFILIHLRQHRKFEAPYPAIRASGDTALMARGKYLVYGPAHCANCHASGRSRDWTLGHFIQRFWMGKLVAQSHMPWGPFSRMSDEEQEAIYNYLQTLKPVDNKLPPAFIRK